MTAKESAVTFFSKTREFLQQEVISGIKETIIVMDIVFAVLLIVGAYLLLRWIKIMIHSETMTRRLSVGQQFAYYQLAKYFLVVITFVLVLQSLHQNVTILLAGSAALLVGIGLGLQQLFNDLVSGFFLLFEDTVRVGDIIEVDGMVSRVKEIGIRTSRVKNRDGIVVVIPNSKIVSNSVINWSTDSSVTRFNIAVGVAYGSEVDKVRKVLIDCAFRHKEVVNSPKPICRFTDFADSSLNMELLFWTRNRFRVEDVKSDLRFMINSEFIKHNIKIPFPQRDLHFKTDFPSSKLDLNSDRPQDLPKPPL